MSGLSNTVTYTLESIKVQLFCEAFAGLDKKRAPHRPLKFALSMAKAFADLDRLSAPRPTARREVKRSPSYFARAAKRKAIKEANPGLTIPVSQVLKFAEKQRVNRELKQAAKLIGLSLSQAEEDTLSVADSIYDDVASSFSEALRRDAEHATPTPIQPRIKALGRLTDRFVKYREDLDKELVSLTLEISSLELERAKATNSLHAAKTSSVLARSVGAVGGAFIPGGAFLLKGAAFVASAASTTISDPAIKIAELRRRRAQVQEEIRVFDLSTQNEFDAEHKHRMLVANVRSALFTGKIPGFKDPGGHLDFSSATSGTATPRAAD